MSGCYEFNVKSRTTLESLKNSLHAIYYQVSLEYLTRVVEMAGSERSHKERIWSAFKRQYCEHILAFRRHRGSWYAVSPSTRQLVCVLGVQELLENN